MFCSLNGIVLIVSNEFSPVFVGIGLYDRDFPLVSLTVHDMLKTLLLNLRIISLLCSLS
jgi:hypothetical protein